MINTLKVMILEDRAIDQELVKRQVLKYEPKSLFLIAKDKKTFLEKIDWFNPDIILADYNLPDYTGLDALIHLKEKKPFIPFAFVTGGLDPNDPVADIVLKNADGFVLKDNLSTLHIELETIMKKMEEKINAQKEINEKIIKRKIKLLKAINLLNESGHFSGKEELMTLLKSIDQDFDLSTSEST